MSIIIKTEEEIQLMREGGKILAGILGKVAQKVAPGVSTYELDQYAYELIKQAGDEPAFLNYRPEGVSKPYPASLCTSVNNEIVHGVPRKDKILKEGDIISLDLGIKHKGLFTDHAITVPVGSINRASRELLAATKEALSVGIMEARAGNTVGDIGHAIEKFVARRYGIVRELSGHGVGRYVHEDPYVPNFGKPGRGERLVPGMVIAIEPMLNVGKAAIVNGSDEYTVLSADSSRSAHFEHTVLITDGEPEVLTMV
jgi:methionyl aminopeptidase